MLRGPLFCTVESKLRETVLHRFKVLFIHKSTLGASGEASIHYYPTCLASLGHEVTIVACEGGKSEFLAGRGVRVIEISRGDGWNAGVRNAIKDAHPDIVHVFLYTGCSLVPLMSSWLRARPRYVLDIRSPLLRIGLMRVLHRVKNVVEPLPFDAIATHSVESAWTQVGRKSGLVFLPPGVDISSVPKNFRNVGDSTRTTRKMVYIGSLDKLRNLHSLIDAFVQAALQVPLELDIYGDGNDRAALERRIAATPFAASVRFHGTIDRQKLFTKLPQYDFGLAYVPGGMYETAPALKTLEYLACGLPVLATNTAGNRMFVTQDYNGLLAGPDAFSFGKAMQEICQSETLERYRAHARESVEQYDWSIIVKERLLPLYFRLLNQSGGDVFVG